MSKKHDLDAKIDGLRHDLAEHERRDRDSHDKLSEEVARVASDVRVLVERGNKDTQRIDAVEEKVSSMAGDVSDLVEDKKKREEWRTFVIQRILWIIVPALVLGLTALLAESFGIVDIIPNAEKGQ